MALSKIDAANFLTGTIPSGNVANATLNAVTALPGAIATGKVLQVVQGSNSTQVQISGASLQSLGLSADITPSATSSKILILTSLIGYQRAQTTDDVNAYGSLLRDSKTIHNAQSIQRDQNDTGKENMMFTLNMEYLDSPSSTSQITYSARAGSDNFVLFSISGNSTQTITLMEIAG